MHRTAAAPALVCLVLLAGASGCGDGPDDAAGPETAAPNSSGGAPTTTPPPADDPADFPPGVVPADGGHGSGNGLGVTGVRVARHEGFDRVVFDLGGEGTPGWRVDYVASPRAEGSGDPVRLEGSAFLQVILRGVGLPYDTGLEPFGDHTTRLAGTGTQGVTEIAPGGVFEGEQQAFIGLSGEQRPFRVFALTGPTRVVVDVRAG